MGPKVGQPAGEGSGERLTEEFIGLNPGENLIGVKIQEAKDPNREDTCMIGKVAFTFVGPAQKKGFHWSYSGYSVNHEDSKNYVESLGGALLSLQEA